MVDLDDATVDRRFADHLTELRRDGWEVVRLRTSPPEAELFRAGERRRVRVSPQGEIRSEPLRDE